jgi:hypothetical protein
MIDSIGVDISGSVPGDLAPGWFYTICHRPATEFVTFLFDMPSLLRAPPLVSFQTCGVELGVAIRREFLTASSAVILGSLRRPESVHLSLLELNWRRLEEAKVD